jgi:pyruvate formate lyase activating enzyme
MVFGGFQKLTLLDFPGVLSCIAFTNGCNFRCPFCHNASLVRKDGNGTIEDIEILEFLKKRKGVLEGICISGGEPLMHSEIKDFLIKVKMLGYKVKLDTNGSYPERLKELCSLGLVDYVAMDIKNSFDKYADTAGCDVPIDNIKESIRFLLEGSIDYEFRTTLVKELHTIEDMENIANEIKNAKRYYLQNFVDSGDILCGNLSPLTKEEMENMQKIASKHLQCVHLRGI